MKFSKQERELYKRGSDNDRKKLLNSKLNLELKILKESPDLNLLQKSQGRAEILEEILSTFD